MRTPRLRVLTCRDGSDLELAGVRPAEFGRWDPVRGFHASRRGVIHLASIPLVMGFQKLRHLMEQFGEVGRVYLAPEEPIKGVLDVLAPPRCWVLTFLGLVELTNTSCAATSGSSHPLELVSVS